MQSKYLVTLIFCLLAGRAMAQFPPPAGHEGSTAIHADSSVFMAWANQVTIERGCVQIDQPSLGNASYGTDSVALGKADNVVVSLGDGGTALYQLNTAMGNGAGPDFAVFENSMWDNFLELCFVEVSSDGVNFFRFDAISNVQVETQIGGFGTIDATQIHNFGGKYRALYGTPFDLEELANTPGLDVNHITHVKLIDVVGNIDPSYATYDSQGIPVNDPWPTPYPTAGFDLDALGIIHQTTDINNLEASQNGIHIFQAPANSIFVNLDAKHLAIAELQVFDLGGKLQTTFKQTTANKTHDVRFLPIGMYIVNVQQGNVSKSVKNSFEINRYGGFMSIS